MSELYCKTCQRFYDATDMVQVTEWKRKNTALFLDRKNGTSHEFLTEAESLKMKILPAEPVTSLHIPEQVAEVPAPAAIESGSITVPDVSKSSTAGQDAAATLFAAAVTEEATSQPIAANPASSDAASEVVSEGEPVPHGEAYEDWLPQDSDWVSATIDFWAPGFLFATLSNTEKVFCSRSTFTNMPHQHDCNNFIKAGDAIQVRMERHKQPNPRSPKWTAIETVFLEDYALAEEEAVSIIWWDAVKDIGVGERNCGCRTFVAAPTPYDWRRGDDAVISGWEKSRHPEHRGVVATKIRIMQPTIPLETIHPMGTFNPSEDDGDDLIRI